MNVLLFEQLLARRPRLTVAFLPQTGNYTMSKGQSA